MTATLSLGSRGPLPALTDEAAEGAARGPRLVSPATPAALQHPPPPEYPLRTFLSAPRPESQHLQAGRWGTRLPEWKP